MQNYTTIIGVIEMRSKNCTYDECQNRYHIGSGTVTLILKRFGDIGLSLEDLKQMDPKKVEDAFYPPGNIRRKNIPLPDYQRVYDQLMKDASKANLFYLWLKYKKDNPEGYQYTQFCHYFNAFMKLNHGSGKLTMAVERTPGEKLFIDWIGDKPKILVDSETGEIKEVHVFLTTVGVSSLIYAEIFPDEKLTSFITGTVHALEFYNAIPKYLVPDNCRTAVTKHTKDELVINSVYQDIEDFYDVVILPPPPRKPKGKPTVEKYVQYLETHLLYDDHYYSVLYTYFDQPAILKATMTEIRICDRNNKLICSHKRSYNEFPKYITKDEHMKPEHLFYKEINAKDGSYYRRWASAFGPYMSKLIDTILHSTRHEEQAYNSCNGILHMCNDQSKVLVEDAAKRCVEYNACRYSYFKKVLSDVINTHPSPGTGTNQKLPEHKNIRGKDFYK